VPIRCTASASRKKRAARILSVDLLEEAHDAAVFLVDN